MTFIKCWINLIFLKFFKKPSINCSSIFILSLVGITFIWLSSYNKNGFSKYYSEIYFHFPESEKFPFDKNFISPSDLLGVMFNDKVLQTLHKNLSTSNFLTENYPETDLLYKNIYKSKINNMSDLRGYMEKFHPFVGSEANLVKFYYMSNDPDFDEFLFDNFIKHGLEEYIEVKQSQLNIQSISILRSTIVLRLIGDRITRSTELKIFDQMRLKGHEYSTSSTSVNFEKDLIINYLYPEIVEQNIGANVTLEKIVFSICLVLTLAIYVPLLHFFFVRK